MGSSQYCPGTNNLKGRLLAALDENMIDAVVYKQWVSVNISTLETVCSISEDFNETFCEKLQALLSHSILQVFKIWILIRRILIRRSSSYY